MSRILVPASSSGDSACLLYTLLSETTDDIISRFFLFESTLEDTIKYVPVMEWLRANVRDFEYGFSEYEKSFAEVVPDGDPELSKQYNAAILANRLEIDQVAFGLNMYNWSMANWFFLTDEPIEMFYKRGNPYSRKDHSIYTDYTDVPIIWPMMARGGKTHGRWQNFEYTPDELLSIVSHGCYDCGKCDSCKCRKWYYAMKNEGHTAVDIDMMILEKGLYGPFWVPGNTQATRHRAYEGI